MRDILDTSCLEQTRSSKASELAANAFPADFKDLAFPLPDVKNVGPYAGCVCLGLQSTAVELDNSLLSVLSFCRSTPSRGMLWHM